MRSLLCALSLLACVPVASAQVSVEYPIHYVSQTDDAGLIFNRSRRVLPRNRPAPQPQQPEAPRTQPYDPNTAPKFDAPKQDGTLVENKVTEEAMTPEQKQLLMSAIVSFASALLAVFTHGSTQGGFLGKLIAGLLSSIGKPPVTPLPEPQPGGPTKVKSRGKK